LGFTEIIWLTWIGGREGVTLRGVGARGTLAAAGFAETPVDTPTAELSCPFDVTGGLGSLAALKGLGRIGMRPAPFVWPTWALVPLVLSVLPGTWERGTTLGAAPPETVEPTTGDPMPPTP
jgi:hypothetical protein